MLTLLNCYDSSFWLTDTLSLDSMDLFSDMDGDKLVWFSCFFFRFSRIKADYVVTLFSLSSLLCLEILFCESILFRLLRVGDRSFWVSLPMGEVFVRRPICPSGTGLPHSVFMEAIFDLLWLRFKDFSSLLFS